MAREEDTRIEVDLMLLGIALVSPPSSVQHSVLDELESCLKRVNQSRSRSMQSALDPVSRITAPNILYGDEQRKAWRSSSAEDLISAIKDHQSDVYASMGLTMIMILEKLEEIPPGLFSVLLLGTLRKENL
ncbi:hypothetical protein SADUNF_Sadunf18G0088200 [Salix dunnii]|uniref:Uncharacterized protein n=1 Tax=Salix dunnii TaxID=1413687 RepID=A0A835ME18_9ROSI|nr:hypothetical protein SADUNF_Sadunf18G0088200 [Salix dunnii]